MKKGFTLVELLVVLAFVALIGAGAIVAYEQSTITMKEDELVNTYLNIQRAAVLYMDLDDTSVKYFEETNELYVKLVDLKNMNFVSKKIKNPKDNTELPDSYIVKIYVADKNENKFLDTCILNQIDNSNICVANSDGENGNCCVY